MSLYELTTDVTCHRTARWYGHLRYALCIPQQALALPAGSWLLALPSDADSGEHLYRLPDGRVVARERALTGDEARKVTNPQAIAAMESYRTLEQAALDDWGVHVEHVDHSAPFRLIKCPLCWGTEFASVDFARVWCNICNASFTVRHTSGDPGFCLDVHFGNYLGRHAHYLLPRTADLCLTLVLKDSGDPLDLAYDRRGCWRDDCTPEQVALTGRESALRPGLHACQVGTLYGWSLGGRVPATYDYNQHGWATLRWPDGREESWPATSFTPTSNLTRDEQRALRQVAREIGKREEMSPNYREGLLDVLAELCDRPRVPPYVAYQVPFPDAGRLQEGEKYLLHRWLLKREKQYGMVYGYPVWLVVTADEGETSGRRVVKDNLCPRCGRDAESGSVATSDDEVHRYCRDLWAQTGWLPKTGQVSSFD